MPDIPVKMLILASQVCSFLDYIQLYLTIEHEIRDCSVFKFTSVVFDSAFNNSHCYKAALTKPEFVTFSMCARPSAKSQNDSDIVFA